MIKELTPTFPKPHPSSHDYGRLDSWKEIANFLRREVRTVQLWEKREGLPVHRHFHQQLGSVFALRSEIESWRRRVSGEGGKPGPESPAPARHSQVAAHRIVIRLPPLKNKIVARE